MNRNNRDSNFELLRIIAILFIILHHISIHTQWGNGGVFFPEELTGNAIFLQSILPLGKIGVNLFVLISGFFLINSEKSAWPKIISLWIQMLFYSILVSLLFWLFDDAEFTAREVLSIFTPFVSTTWWYASAYLIMLGLSPFINRVLHACSQKDHLKLILGLIVLWCLIPSLTNMFPYYSELGWFITLYVVAAYLRMYPPRIFSMPRYFLCAAGLIYVALVLVAYAVDCSGHQSEFWGIGCIVDHNNMMNSLFSFGISLNIFLFVINCKIKHSRIINYVAATTFGIYLLHDHPLVRGYLYSELFDCPSYTDSALMIPFVFAVAMSIFLICMGVDFIRMAVFDKWLLKNLPKHIARVQNQIDSKLDRILSK